MPSVRALFLSAALAVTLGGCAQFQTRQGYIFDQTLLDSVTVGIDNKDSVERTLGRPTFSSQFGVAEGRPAIVTPELASEWYYLARTTRQPPFGRPRPVDQVAIRVRFDTIGNVAAIDRTGVETVVRVNPDGDKTPTLGREKSFFEELFGNIGTVGAPGAGAGGAGGPGGR